MATPQEKLMMVPVVAAGDMPKEVVDYCIDHEISVHYASELHQLEDNGNVLAEWLKSLGYTFRHQPDDWPGFDWIGVIGT